MELSSLKLAQVFQTQSVRSVPGVVNLKLKLKSVLRVLIAIAARVSFVVLMLLKLPMHA